MGSMVSLSDQGMEFQVYEALPSREPRGALIVIHEVWGLTDHIKDIANRFAKEGYVVLAPNLLSDTDIEKHMTPDLPAKLFNPETRNEVQPVLRKIMAPIQSDEFAEATVKKLEACFENLWQRGGVKQHIGVAGFCFGGTYSFKLAANEPRLKAAVPFYGHANFDEAELGKITCPILAFYGEKDEGLISSLPGLKTKMQKAGAKFEATVYPNCGHAFFNDTNPYAYNEAATKDAWPKTLAFLSANLG